MSFVCQHQRTQTSLEVWSGPKTILTPRFYFWANGTFLEKSIEGLLRSIIWQILTALVGSQNSEYTRLHSPGPSSQHLLAAWTERRLRSKLREITETALRAYKVCFFIDGLDEFAGDQYDLIECIQDITKSTEVKVCLSSRSYFAFDQAFGGSARLRLQDLTRNDIRGYVTDKLQSVTRPLSAPSSQSISLDDIISKILSRAEGVFLWVSFAVKDQMHGLRNGDSIEQLEERIELLPSDVEGIYGNMVKRIEEPYMKEAAIYLSIILQKGIPLKDLAIMTHSRIDEILSSADPLPEEEMVAFSDFVRGRIMTTCAGLLDVRARMDQSNPIEHMEVCLDWKPGECGESSTGKPVEQSRAVLGNHVDFMHRTAADFIQNSAQGKEFLSANTPKTYQYEVYSIRVQLYSCRQMKNPKVGARSLGTLNDPIESILNSIRMLETRTGRVHENLCDLLDFTISTGFDPKNHANGPSKLHWICQYWQVEPLLALLPAGDKELDLDFSDQGVITPGSRQRSRNGELFRQIGFLCLASLSGLLQYVNHCLELKTGLIGHHEINHLLFCAACGVFVRETKLSIDYLTVSHSLLRLLLRSGADPNSKVCSIRLYELWLQRPTIWLLFLMSIRRGPPLKSSLTLPNESVEHTLSEMGIAWQKSRADFISSFVDNGADLDAIAQFWIQICNFSSATEDTWSYHYAFSLSVLSMTEILLSGKYALPDLRDNCIAQGARRLARCWKIKALRPIRLGQGLRDTTSDIEIALSECESADFFAIHATSLRGLRGAVGGHSRATQSLWRFAEGLRLARYPDLAHGSASTG